MRQTARRREPSLDGAFPIARPEPGFSLVRGARLIDPAKRRAEQADVLVEDSVVRDLGHGLSAPEGARVVEAAGHLIDPGLVNSHMHGHSGLARGQGDKWTLELLLAASPWVGGRRSLQDKKLTKPICGAEMALKGRTAAYDLYGWRRR